MKVILPNNNFGAIVMLILMLLAFIIPFTISLWLISLIAPWWVAFPTSIFISIVVFFKLVKFKS